jgi:YihY family inner membrane protein
VGPQVAGQIEPLTGSGPALGLGLATALWAGLGVTLALGRAFEHIWDVPRAERRGPVRARLHGLAMLAILGSMLIASTLAAGLAVGGAIGPAAQRAATLVLALAVNALVFGAAFALLSPRPRHLRRVLPGAAVAAVGSLLLQALGGWYVDLAIVGAAEVYGAFALVIGLLSWFLIVSQLVLLAAEVNVVLARGLWPRALTGAAPRSRPPAAPRG